MLKGKDFSIYIHNKLAAAKNIPAAANCQLVRRSHQNVLFHENLGILIRANFKNTCPPDNRTHWIRDTEISFHMLNLTI